MWSAAAVYAASGGGEAALPAPPNPHAVSPSQVDAAVTCSASGPYGLAGTIEAFMADSASKSLREFLDSLLKFVQVRTQWQLERLRLQPKRLARCAPCGLPAMLPHCFRARRTPCWALRWHPDYNVDRTLPGHALLPSSPQAPAAGAAPAGAAAGAAAPAAAAPAGEAAELFYDAVELPLPPLPAVPAVPAVVPSGDGLRFEDAALLYLRYMCRTGDQTVGLLQVGAGRGRPVGPACCRAVVGGGSSAFAAAPPLDLFCQGLAAW